MPVKTITKKSLSVEKLSISKKDIEELSILYDRIYNIADRLLKKHNPCNIHIKNNRILCAYYTADKNDELYLPQNKLCCLSCEKYWSKEGCTVKALGCKLFLCQAIKNKVLRKRFQKLRNYGIKHLSFDYCGVDGYKWNYSIATKYHTSKEDWLKKIKENTYETI